MRGSNRIRSVFGHGYVGFRLVSTLDASRFVSLSWSPSPSDYRGSDYYPLTQRNDQGLQVCSSTLVNQFYLSWRIRIRVVRPGKQGKATSTARQRSSWLPFQVERDLSAGLDSSLGTALDLERSPLGSSHVYGLEKSFVCWEYSRGCDRPVQGYTNVRTEGQRVGGGSRRILVLKRNSERRAVTV